MRRGKTPKSELADLMQIPGIGPSIAQDFHDLGIPNTAALRRRDPEKLYHKLCELRGQHQDRCVLYTFRCAVYFATEAQRDPELLKWWNWHDDKIAARGSKESPAAARKTGNLKNSTTKTKQRRISRSFTAGDFRRLALALPDAIESAHMNHPDFRVGGKVFASLGPNEDSGMVKLSSDDQRTFLAAGRATNAFKPANGTWGRRGYTIIDLPKADPSMVREALEAAWRNTAPAKLLRDR